MWHVNALRKSASALVFAFIFLTFSSLCAPALAQNGDLPTRSALQSQLDILNKQKNLSAEDKKSQQDLSETLEILDKIDHIKQEAEQLRQHVAQAPAKMASATNALNALDDGESDASLLESYRALSLHELEDRITGVLDKLQTAQSDLSTLNSQSVSLQTQPERVQNAMYNDSQVLQQVRNQLSGMGPGDEMLRPSWQNSLLAKQMLLIAQIEHQRKSLEGNTVLQDSLQKQRDLASASINRYEHQLQLLQNVVSSKRLTLTEKTAQEAATSDDASRIQNNPLVKQELEINRQLSQHLIDATQAGNHLVQQNIKVKNWLDRALQSERNLKEQIAVLKGSLLLSRILYQQQKNLHSAGELQDMTNRIADLRLEQFEINQQRDALFQGDSWVAALEQGHQSEVNDDVHNALLEISDIRRELLEQLNKQLGNQLMMAINLQVNQQQLISVSQSLEKILTQQIFWVNSNKPTDWSWFQSFPQLLGEQLKSMSFTVDWHSVWPAIAVAMLAGLPLLLLAGLIRCRFAWMRHYLTCLAAEVGQLRKDSQLHTPKAMLINLIRVLPACLIILALGLILREMALPISTLLWAFSKKLALFCLVFGLCWRVLESDGVAIKHFTMLPRQTSHWRRQIVRISLALLPLLFWSVVAEQSPLYLMDDVLGQFMIFLNLMVIAALVWPMCRDSWRDKHVHATRLVVITTLSVVPILLLVLTITGYFYTALRLTGRWIDTVYLVIIWNLLYQSILRGLSVAARRIAFRRALSRRKSQAKEGPEGVEPVEEPPLALDQINQQTLRITTLTMFALFGLVFWAIWSDLITVFSYLDSIVLWHYNGSEAGVTVIKSVTMGSMLFALAALVVALLLIRNLPGLLEVLLLSRLSLRQGTSYAITTILNYIIIAVGAMMVFASLGVSWDKLQWLAAALSVGLGFGLQEIFGNFVSGLIILFERPVRIGDTVTIGTFSGTVNKIRIRATTITDFDRKEVIIPNKAFVTERLINWSLSDTITRVVIRLGVAYGSDLDKVKAVLLQAASEHPKVMHDPEPSVFFTAFGASTLDHELRLYVRELRDRSSTVDELNRAIDRLCRENQIDIAFNQLEVHLRNEKGEEHTEVKRDAQGNSGNRPLAPQ